MKSRLYAASAVTTLSGISSLKHYAVYCNADNEEEAIGIAVKGALGAAPEGSNLAGVCVKEIALDVIRHVAALRKDES